ncbi:hypothetical protein B4U79_01430, partial [Dinothrombium tinctorium]
KEDGYHPVAYESRLLRGAEVNYSITEKECLAVVFACVAFRSYLLGHFFKIVTDHTSLTWLLNKKDPSRRCARWIMILTEFNFEIEYKSGKLHLDADFFSRNPIDSDNKTMQEFVELDNLFVSSSRIRRHCHIS